MKIAIGNLIGIALNLYVALGTIVILTILILQIQEHDISLQLLVSFLIYFMNILQLFEYSSFALFGKFVPRYFIS